MEVLKPLIEQLVKTMQGSADLAKGQFPDVANQIVRLYLWGNVIEIPILIGIMSLGYWACLLAYKKQEETNEPWMLAWIPIGLLEIVVGVYAYGCTQTMLKAILAPKVLIIECLKGYL